VVRLTPYSSTPTVELIAICVNSRETAAWDEFVSRFHRAICLSVIRAARQWGEPPQQVLDDLVQETYLRLCEDHCRSLLAFATQHSDAIPGYIKTIAVNLVHDHFKSRRSQKRGAGMAQESLEGIDPSAGSESLGSPRAIERRVLLQQIDQCLDACSAGPDQERDRMIFWLYYQQGLSATAIAAVPAIGLTAKGVESAILRLTRLVRQKVVSLRSEPSGGTESGQKGFRPAESY
jgi:RNA polymerase sigma-70 factor (ECF subfamily)